MRSQSTPFADAAALAALLLVGCEPEPAGTPWSSPTDPTVGRPGADTGGETDADADVDADTDVDADADADADTDTDTDTDPDHRHDGHYTGSFVAELTMIDLGSMIEAHPDCTTPVAFDFAYDADPDLSFSASCRFGKSPPFSGTLTATFTGSDLEDDGDTGSSVAEVGGGVLVEFDVGMGPTLPDDHDEWEGYWRAGSLSGGFSGSWKDGAGIYVNWTGRFWAGRL